MRFGVLLLAETMGNGVIVWYSTRSEFLHVVDCTDEINTQECLAYIQGSDFRIH